MGREREKMRRERNKKAKKLLELWKKIDTYIYVCKLREKEWESSRVRKIERGRDKRNQQIESERYVETKREKASYIRITVWEGDEVVEEGEECPWEAERDGEVEEAPSPLHFYHRREDIAEVVDYNFFACMFLLFLNHWRRLNIGGWI